MITLSPALFKLKLPPVAVVTISAPPNSPVGDPPPKTIATPPPLRILPSANVCLNPTLSYIV